ncbi:hypothetical protein FNH22_07615 [Fulvivirga sp. M361]|uniref:hypothetical protein n=1 Tax=Fulvivirga sp. M361 TaxID=2594266 RepID=UPI001179F191|nr:hypothetical protein [Fulvivirga sp. M361]TRX59912.1 hypothetical protein FNH22_07615 [Fulvivirga sp. M361]
MTKYLTLLLSFILLVSCTISEPLSEDEKALIRDDILEMFGHYFDDIKRDGLMAEFRYLDKSRDFFWAPPGYRSALSYDSVKIILKENARHLEKVEFSWDTLQVFPITHEIATYSGVVKGVIHNTFGDVSSVLMIESGTLIKRKDGWKLLSGQSAHLDIQDSKVISTTDSIK